MTTPVTTPPPKLTQPGPLLTPKRLAVALLLAVVSDGLSLWLEFLPPGQWTLDIMTALLLFFVLGRQWAILPALVAEAIPGLAAFPAWVLVVVSIGTWGYIKRQR